MFRFQVTLVGGRLDPDDPDSEGDVLVEGLYLQAIGWDTDSSSLIESKSYISEAAPIYISAITTEQHNKWTEATKQQSKNIYVCPMFTTSVGRAVCVQVNPRSCRATAYRCYLCHAGD